MGVLENSVRDVAVSLSTRSTVGRSSSSSLAIRDEAVSGVHASIEWTGDRWALRDLGSRNGTYLNDARVRPYEATFLAEGFELAFGDPQSKWRLAHAGPPQLVARSPSRVFAFPEEDILILPDAAGAELTLIRDGQQWEYEVDSTTQYAVDQTTIELASGHWLLLVPEVLSETTLIGSDATIRDVALRFVTSRDEEHVEILADGPSVHEHFDHRAHSYLLLTLARLRLADSARADLPISEHGWIDRDHLEDLLKIETPHLNLLIYRARRQLAAIGVKNASALIERRSGSSQLRIGATDLAVIDPE